MLKLTLFEDETVAAKSLNIGCGQVIYQSDTPAKHVYLLQQGEVRLYTVGPAGATRLVTIVGPGDWFGAGALAGFETFGMKAVAVHASTVLEAPVERMLQALSQHPTELLELSRDLAKRLITATCDASSLVFEDCNQRLINTLVRFSQSAASVPHDDGVVLRITHDQLAQAVGVARETVSLALTQLRQQNLLRTGRNQLVFNPERLRELKNGNGSVSRGAAVAV